MGFFGKNNLYEINLHKHVKVWLSKDKNVFMSLTNQLRLIRARVTNPNDSISLVYDSRLLSKKAINELNQFCEQHQITPHDMKRLGEQCHTTEEKTLISMYEDEINNLENGGNLAAASDILRCLNPVFSLGIYTDFDAAINTQNLPEVILSKKPVLINCGMIENEFYYSNDIIAVSNSKAGVDLMTLLQRTMIDKCQGKMQVYKKRTLPITKNNLADDQWQWHEKILSEALHEQFSIREFRYFIRNLHSETVQDIVQRPLNFKQIQKLDADYKKQGNDIEDLPSKIVSKIKEEMYIRSVVNTTGPTIYRHAFAPKGNWNSTSKCGGFAELKLLDAFKGYIPGVRKNKNDFSWLPRGEININQNEGKIISDFKKVLKAYKNYKKKQICEINSEEEQSDEKNKLSK